MTTFKKEVLKGLQQEPKKVLSQYFYDAKGDALFQKIMKLDEYYLPKSELNIINTHTNTIAKSLKPFGASIEILELGAGDGTKTVELLSGFVNQNFNVTYIPFDISPNVLEINKQTVTKKLSNIEVKPIAGNYFETYLNLSKEKKQRLVLFLGSNLGNYTLKESSEFLKHLKSGLKKDDHILLAFDLIKHPRKVIKAYDDAKGVTREFNLNILERINRELNANFNLDKFDHYPYYNPVTGVTYSYLISLEKQTVHFESGEKIHFKKYEPIHTEVSKKFTEQEIINLSSKNQFEIEDWFYDSEKTYCFVLLKNKQ